MNTNKLNFTKQRDYFVLFIFLTTFFAGSLSVAAKNYLNSENAPYQEVVIQEKRNRTTEQRKIDSQLLYALYRWRGEAETKGVPVEAGIVKVDEEGKVTVSIRARVSKQLLIKIKSLGGKIISSSALYNDIQVNFPIKNLEKLAARKDVIAINPVEQAITNHAN